MDIVIILKTILPVIAGNKKAQDYWKKSLI